MLRTGLVFGLLAVVGPFAIDMYLPALPRIAGDLNATEAQIQATLTAYFVTFGLGQLFYGPMADQTGRKAPIVLGLAVFLAGAPQRDGVQHGHVVAHDCGFPDHDRMGMVYHHALTDPRTGVDIDAKDFGRSHLKEIGHVHAPLYPQMPCDAMGLHRLITLEEHQRLDQPVAGRIALQHGDGVGACDASQFGIGIMRLRHDLANQPFGHLARGQLLPQPVAQRVLEATTIQNTGMNQSGQPGLIRDHGRSLIADARPHRIERLCNFACV
jgi:hypothetical protein